jgi:hypothetical protein
MKKNWIKIVYIISFNITNYSYAQVKIGLNPSTIDPNSFLEVQSQSGSKFCVTKDSSKIGIGTLTPQAKLDVIGNVKITDGTQGFGKVFTSDANGVGSWTTPSSATSGSDLTSSNGIIVTGGTGTTLKSTSLRLDSNAVAKMINQSPVKDSLMTMSVWNNKTTNKGAVSISESVYRLGDVAVGTSTPDPSAVLDVNSSTKGFLIPRINLTSTTMQIGSAANATSLIVYNSGSVLAKGIYFWNGTEWRAINSSNANAASISSINCYQAELSPGTYVSGSSYLGQLSVPYTGGNGGIYSAGSPVTVNGLTYTLQEGKLNFGNGNLIFKVSGVPTISSPTPMSLTINSAIVPFYTGSCSATFGDVELAETKTAVTIGPLRQTSNPTSGYINYVTSPDGKYSVAVFIESGYVVALSDIRIRSNVGTPTIMWNCSFQWVTSGNGVYGNNAMTFPASGVWYGNGGGNGTTMGVGLGQAWADPDVYAGSPEYRRYSWTTIDSNDKTYYEFYFMLGAPNDQLIANTTNCPNGTCVSTKAFMKIIQYSIQ